MKNYLSMPKSQIFCNENCEKLSTGAEICQFFEIDLKKNTDNKFIRCNECRRLLSINYLYEIVYRDAKNGVRSRLETSQLNEKEATEYFTEYYKENEDNPTFMNIIEVRLLGKVCQIDD